VHPRDSPFAANRINWDSELIGFESAKLFRLYASRPPPSGAGGHAAVALAAS